MYVMLIPSICGQVSDAVYCLNVNHFDKLADSGVTVSRGDEICWIKYEHLPKLGFWGFLTEQFAPSLSYEIAFRSPVNGKFEYGFGSSFHHLRYRDYANPFIVNCQKDEVDQRVAYRFYTNEKIKLPALEFYREFFAVFFDHEEWADAGMRDSSNYYPDWKERLMTEKRFLQRTICPVVPIEQYRSQEKI